MDKKYNSGMTTADVYFMNNERRPKKNCEAWINKDGSIDCIMIDGMMYKPKDLSSIDVAAVDIRQIITYYIQGDR